MRLGVLLLLAGLTWAGKEPAQSLGQRVDEWIRTLQAESEPLPARLEALKHLARQLASADDALRAKLVRAVVGTLLKAPPELAVVIFEVLATQIADARLLGVLVHFVHPHGTTPDVRSAAATAAAMLAGIAALPTLLHCLDDDDPEVVEHVARALRHVCWPLKSEEKPRTKWKSFARTEAGSKLLAAAFVKLKAILKPQGARSTPLPLVAHVVPLLLDAKIPYDAWIEGYRFLKHYVREEFRPEERRGQPVTPAERPEIVAAIRAWRDA